MQGLQSPVAARAFELIQDEVAARTFAYREMQLIGRCHRSDTGHERAAEHQQAARRACMIGRRLIRNTHCRARHELGASNECSAKLLKEGVGTTARREH